MRRPGARGLVVAGGVRTLGAEGPPPPGPASQPHPTPIPLGPRTLAGSGSAFGICFSLAPPGSKGSFPILQEAVLWQGTKHVVFVDFIVGEILF